MTTREAAGSLIGAWRRPRLRTLLWRHYHGPQIAARFCAEARGRSWSAAAAREAVTRPEDLGNLELKGVRRPVVGDPFGRVPSHHPPELLPLADATTERAGAVTSGLMIARFRLVG
jgi:hypothetical protein